MRRAVQAAVGMGVLLVAAVALLVGCSSQNAAPPVPSATFTPTPESAWARVVPVAWHNPSEAGARYGVYIEYTPQIVETCLYHVGDGPATFKIERQQLEVTVRVRDLQTRRVIHRETFDGEPPDDCPDHTSRPRGAINQTYAGSMPSIIKFEKWLLGLFLEPPGEYDLPPLTPSMTPTATRTITPGPTLFWSASATPAATPAGPMARALERESDDS